MTGNGLGTVSRIAMISPLQNEMLRRNRSRIFITVAGESPIDSVLFSGQRPIEEFIPAAARAIYMAGLKDIAGETVLTAAFEHTPAAGFMQQHLVSRGWLEDKDNNVVDLIVELDPLPFGENIAMKTSDAVNQIDGSNENPLVIFCGIEDLYPQLDEAETGQRSRDGAGRRAGRAAGRHRRLEWQRQRQWFGPRPGQVADRRPPQGQP
jgi:hypothetical protein